MTKIKYAFVSQSGYPIGPPNCEAVGSILAQYRLENQSPCKQFLRTNNLYKHF